MTELIHITEATQQQQQQEFIDLNGLPRNDDKAPACNVGRPGFDFWVEKIPVEGRKPIPVLCLKIPLMEEPAGATVHGIARS